MHRWNKVGLHGSMETYVSRSALALAVVLTGCGGDAGTGDTGVDEVAAYCDGELGTPTVWLGEGVGGAFAPLEDGALVALEIAPQGGFGVSVQVRTEGLQGDAPAEVTVRTEIGGEPDASFTFVDASGQPTQQLFCLDDGRSALGAGVSVGFDADRWRQDNLTELDGVVADLVVEVTDARGVTASGRTTVTLVVGS